MLAVAKVDTNRGLKLIEIPEPKISDPNDVLIEVGACGICGTDLDIYASEEIPLAVMSPHGWPRVLGHEVAGMVKEVGKDVTGFREGDHVVCETSPPCGFCFYCRRGQPNVCEKKRGQILGLSKNGGLAKYIVTSANALYKMPKDIPFEEASLLVTLGTAYRSIERSHVKPGDTVVVIGPGPIGILGTMLLQLNGIQTLIVAGRTSSRERLKVAAELGVQTIDINEKNLEEEVYTLTDGRGADVVFEFAGGAQPLTQAVRIARPGGEVVTTSGGAAGEFELHWLTYKELTLLGTRSRQPSTWHRAINLMVNHAADFKKVITHVLPLTEYEKAFELLFDRKALKVILVP